MNTIEDFKNAPVGAPLPDPEPDWLAAPAVLATMNAEYYQEVWLPLGGGFWMCTCCQKVRHWPDLENVVPLYPCEQSRIRLRRCNVGTQL